MGLPIYHDQMYQNAPPITKYTNITQNPPNLSLKTWKTSKGFTKSQQNLKKMFKYANITATPAVFRNRVSSLTDSNVPKDPTHSFLYKLKEVSFHALQMPHPKRPNTT